MSSSNALDGVFTVAGVRPARDGMTISRDTKLGKENVITFFALGAGTSISQERYDTTSVYIGAEGDASFITGEDAARQSFTDGDMLIVPGGTLCGVDSESGAVYTEIIIKKEITMNNLVKAGEVMKLKDLIQYEDGSISNLDVASNPSMKFVLMAFDAGTGLSEHAAPGEALVMALDGEAVIGYEGQEQVIHAGETFKFDKFGKHSVSATKQFKMALLLVLE